LTLDLAKQTLNNTLTLDTPLSDTNTETLKPKTLLHELQLGEQLNESVHQARRADFSLMLAMLCDDVREQSQFIVPQLIPQQNITEKTLTASSLRKQFDLPEQAPLAITDLAQINNYNQAQDIVENSLTNIHLTDAIKPKPLAFRDDASHIANNVMSNTSLVCQAKHAQQDATIVLNKRLSMDAKGWLKNIQTSLVKSRLVEVAA